MTYAYKIRKEIKTMVAIAVALIFVCSLIVDFTVQLATAKCRASFPELPQSTLRSELNFS